LLLDAAAAEALEERSKSKSSMVSSISTFNKIRQSSSSSDEPQLLDRFGLPIQTADNVFPPLSSEYELTPCCSLEEQQQNSPPSVAEIQKILLTKNRLSLNADACKKLGIKVNLLHVSPPVIEMENFFSKQECEEYLKISKSGDDQFDCSGALMVESPKISAEALSRRTSTTWFCNYEQVPSLLAKASNLLEKPVEHFEEPQVVR